MKKEKDDTPADYSSLRVFGCPTYAHVNDDELEQRAKKCIFLGYASRVKGYKVVVYRVKIPRVNYQQRCEIQ